MILSHSNRYIFVKTRKCATSSIESVLFPHLGPDDICTGSINDGTPKLNARGINPHASARFIKRKFPNEWSQYHTFSVVRNPFDSLVSFFYFHKSIEPKNKLFNKDFQHFVKTANLKNWNDWGLLTARGKILVDEIYKYEELEMLKTLNLKGLEKLSNVFIKGDFRTTKDYKPYYDDKLISIVEEKFADYLKAFNYSF